MQCPKCGAELPAKAKFCLECGSNISAISGASEQEQGEVSLGGLRTIAPERAADAGGGESIGDLKTLTGPGEKSGAGLMDGAGFAERYELIEEIGRGGFASVWKAKDKKLGRMVAVKKLHPEHDGMAVARFKREAQAIAQLNHRNIVGVYDVGEQAGEIWLVMELIEGGSLRDLLKQKGKLSLEEALPLFKGIAQGLAYAHRKNLVHRDIKPANILLSQNIEEVRGLRSEDSSDLNGLNDFNALTPKIVDFGLAQAGRDSELSMSGYGMGTPYYMPPEQRRDAKSVNHTADIYALGKVLYEMVTGEIPDTLDPEEIPPPPALAQIIFKCTKPKPEDRFFSVDELLQELEEIDGHKKHKKAQKAGVTNNSCPSCGAENGEDVKFCEACGTGLTRICPECGRENSIHKQFCGSCGTDIEAFIEAEGILDRMRKYREEKKWSRLVKEGSGFSPQSRLPGAKGSLLNKNIASGTEEGQTILGEIKRLELGISNYGHEISDAEVDADQQLLKDLTGLSKLKPLSEEQVSLEKEAKVRIEERRRADAERIAKAKRIEAEIKAERWRQGQLIVKYRAKRIGIGLAGVMVAWIAMDQTMLAMRKSAFDKAIAHKQLNRAQSVAEKLDGRYYTAGNLELLRQALYEKREFESSVAGRVEAGTIFELLKRFGGTPWTVVEQLVQAAEAPGDPAVAIDYFQKAVRLVQVIRMRIEAMLKAEEAFSKGWKISADLLKKHEPDSFSRLSGERDRLQTLTDPVAAEEGWKALAAELTAASRRIKPAVDAKEAYEFALRWQGEALLKQYAPVELAEAQSLAADAEKASGITAAAALWQQAAAAIEVGALKLIPKLKVDVTPSGADLRISNNEERMMNIEVDGTTLEKGMSYTLTVSKKDHNTFTETLTADWMGLKTKRITLEEWSGPEEGQKWVAELGGGVEMEFMPVAAGSFMRESSQVTLSKPFWMAKTEVTQAQYQQVMGSNPSNFKGAQNPVETVSWNDAMEFCRKLTALERQAGRLPEGWEYTLPTEAQWEYACRAGTTGDYAGNLDSMAWYSSNSGNKTHPVGTKQANAWGLYDMHGNVWEWCLDDWHWSYSGAPTDGSRWGDGSGSGRVDRGGGWLSDASRCRSASRAGINPADAGRDLGFRACLVRK